MSFVGFLSRMPGSIARSWVNAYSGTGGFLAATLIGWFVEFLYGLVSQGFLGGIRVFCLLWFASGAAFFVGTIAGFLFGVPKVILLSDSAAVSTGLPQTGQSRPNFPGDADTYKDNTNLEEVSDWLTKIIVGLGLVEFNKIILFLDEVSSVVGKAVDPTGAFGGNVIALGSIIVGFSTGFLYYYVWTRMILRQRLAGSINRGV